MKTVTTTKKQLNNLDRGCCASCGLPFDGGEAVHPYRGSLLCEPCHDAKNQEAESTAGPSIVTMEFEAVAA